MGQGHYLPCAKQSARTASVTAGIKAFFSETSKEPTAFLFTHLLRKAASHWRRRNGGDTWKLLETHAWKKARGGTLPKGGQHVKPH